MCLAYKAGRVHEFPIKKVSKAKPQKDQTYYIYEYAGKILLYKRPQKGIWGGLYSLPEIDLNKGVYQETIVEGQKHKFTHFDLLYHVKTYSLLDPAMIKLSSAIWVEKSNINKLGLPKPIKEAIGIYLKS